MKTEGEHLMKKSSAFTFIRRFGAMLLLAAALLLLGGCQAPDAHEPGWFAGLLAGPFSDLIKMVAGLFGDNYGLSIIVITLLIRLALLPIMLKQRRDQLAMNEKMRLIQPELQKLQEKYGDKPHDAKAQQLMQQEMMQLYKKHDFNPMAAFGCLPILVQLPILMGFYYAIIGSPDIATHSFLWFNLGQSDTVMPIIAILVSLLNVKVSEIGSLPRQQKSLTVLSYLSPLFIGLISFNAPAALPLYWSVSGLFLIFQHLLAQRMYKANSATTVISE
jgi:YidC/Oxa1 family membrane protein insertase